MSDLSTIGAKFGWAAEATAGTKPTAFTWIPRCSEIAGIKLTKDKIDVTCLEDSIKKYIGGVSDTGGDFTTNFNGSTEFVEAWNDVLDAQDTAQVAGKSLWANIWIPNFGSYFIIFEPGEIPMPDIKGGEKVDIQITNVIKDFKGLGTAIEPTA